MTFHLMIGTRIDSATTKTTKRLVPRCPQYQSIPSAVCCTLRTDTTQIPRAEQWWGAVHGRHRHLAAPRFGLRAERSAENP